MSNCCSSLPFLDGGLRLNGDCADWKLSFENGTLLLPRTNELGRFFGGVRLIGEFFKFIKNARSYMIRVPEIGQIEKKGDLVFLFLFKS